MFKFLKDKLKGAISNLSKKAEEEAAEEVEEAVEEKEDRIKELEKEKKELEKKEKEIEKKIEEKKEKPKKEDYKKKLNILDEKGKIVGKESREKIHKEGLLHQEVHVLVFNNKGELLFQKRAPDMETFPNLLDASAGGHVEVGEDYPSAAVKETEEEIGLKINKSDLIFIGDFKNKAHDKVMGKINYVLRKVYAYQLKEDEKLEKNEEVTSLEFCPLKKIFDLNKEEKKKFIPTIISEKYLEFYRKIEGLVEKPAPKPKKEKKPEIEDIKKEIKEVKAEEKEAEKEKKGFLSKLAEKITKTKVSEANFEKLFWDLEVVLLENNVAVEVIGKIKDDLKESLVDNPIPRGKIEKVITDSLKKSLTEVLSVEPIDLLKEVKKKKPYVLCFIGINGSGKTTSIAKVVQYLKKNSLSCVIAASDTFRAAAIDQMQEHADKLDVKLIKHDYGADAAAVAFDAVKHAEAKEKDVVLIDTAGRMHSNSNLMDEMKKIVRVAKPDMNVFVGESIVGNDCIEQAKKFDEAVGIDGIILSKADVDEKGGAAISISYITKKPIIFIGTGQEYDDLKAFEPDIVLESLGL